MALKEHIDDICNRLRRKEFTLERQVTDGIVRRLLNVLSWDVYDMTVVTSEYSVENRRVDLALCNPPSKPLVFIEVKLVGQIDQEAERQLLEYAFYQGVPVAVLTDGKEWHFFYPSGFGDFKERRVYKLDLIEMDSGEGAERLRKYLNYESICTGEAIKAIEDDYREIAKQRRIEASFPEAWIKLMQEEHMSLIEVVAKKTESQCGDKPSGNQVLNFLRSLKMAESPPIVKPLPPTAQKPQSYTGKEPPTRLVVTMHNANPIAYPNAIKTFAEAIERLGIERVRSVYPNLMSSVKSSKYGYQIGRFYVKHQTNTKAKKKMLDCIASQLGVQMAVKIVPKD